ncbi:PHD/FYVE-zinc-finger like domain-containing protein [Xylariaceae sp. FL0255]|nr:PHD/FYVE-zinc-finger like domain-containing protein [Xylariaceae sp. FL0255]
MEEVERVSHGEHLPSGEDTSDSISVGENCHAISTFPPVIPTPLDTPNHEDFLAAEELFESNIPPPSNPTEGGTTKTHRPEYIHEGLEVTEMGMREDEESSSAHDNDIDTASLSSPNRLFPIQVVLAPPADPESYERIPWSDVIERILDEFIVDGDVVYNVEYRDGRIEDASYKDVIQCKGGLTALQAADEDRHARLSVNSHKRPRSEDEYEDEDSGSDFGHRKNPKRRQLRPTRRSTRHQSEDILASADAQDPYRNGDIRHHLVDLSEDQSDEDPLESRDNRLMTTSTFAGRLSRPRQLRKRQPTVMFGSGDELTAQDDDMDSEDDFTFIKSDLAPSTRASKRKKGKAPRLSTMVYRNRRGDDSEIEFEPTRRSGRSSRNRRNLRDPEFEEFELVEERTTSAPKHTAIKEVFKDLAPDSDFAAMHSNTCELCQNPAGGARGSLIYCQGCSFSYHKGCIGYRAVREQRVTKVGEDDFVLQCKFCISLYRKKDARAPDHSLCQLCKVPGKSCAEFSMKKTPKQEERARIENEGNDPITIVNPTLLNNPNNVLFRCTKCKCAYHFLHLPPFTRDMEGKNTSENIPEILEECSLRDWQCKDCLNYPWTMQALVAWRPSDQRSHHPVKTIADYDEDSIEYLVKWVNRSHFHDLWRSGAWVFGVAHAAMRVSFHKRDSSIYPKMDTKSAIEEEWLLPEIVLNVKYRTRVTTSTKAEDLGRIDEVSSIFVKMQGLPYEEAVWDEPPSKDSGAPWDAFRVAYDEYLNGKYFVSISDHKMRERILKYRSLNFGEQCELKSQPPQLKQGRLMDYQMEGVNFLLYNFHQQRNVILADEMGLGKTVQIVAFISALTHSSPECWPFLVVVPNATCANWRRELKTWAPDLRVVSYHGGKVAQDLAYKHELYPEGVSAGLKAHVVIMSYEAASNIQSTFRGVKWVGLVVDEGQRLKNEETNLYKTLHDLRIPCRILLTGTPLQNNKRELFNLLQFIDPEKNAERLDTQYSVLTKDNIPALHDLIRPYFLRRTKAQVLKFLPGMAQIILPVTMTVLQEKLSKSIMARNPELIKAIISKSKIKAKERKSLTNILSDLRQCLCHPFCFNGEIEDKTVDLAQMHRNLIEASPKLLLLNIMLPMLKERGHRVLIFSQFLHCLTILEDFFTGLGLAHARIDGSLSALEKQKKIDAFNAPESPLFAMLLSTRAGGVGINLATADTVIIYDPDFNPHQDIQALSRAHRIGQKRKVLCFQLTTKNTVEEKIMQAGKAKMALDHALIEKMDSKDEAGEDLESILRHGAAALFSDELTDKITYDRASVEKLLDRSKVENTGAGEDESAETQFSFARIWENNKGELQSKTEPNNNEDPDLSSLSIWENILKEREAEHQRELEANQKVYGRGARRGTQVDYKANRPREVDSGEEEVSGDELYIDQNDAEDEEEEYAAPHEAESKEVAAEILASGLQSKSRKPKATAKPRQTAQLQAQTQHQSLTVNLPSNGIPQQQSTIQRPSGAQARPRGPLPVGRPQKTAQSLPTSTATLPPSQPPAPPITIHRTPGIPPPQPSWGQVTHPGRHKHVWNPALPSLPPTHHPPHFTPTQPAPGTPPHHTWKRDPSMIPPVMNLPSRAPHSAPMLLQPPVLQSNAPNLVRPQGQIRTTTGHEAPVPALTLQETGPGAFTGYGDVTLPSGHICTRGLIGGGSPCVLCARNHSVENPCVNLHSESSIRIALDLIRDRTELSAQHARQFLKDRIEKLKGRAQ